MERILREDEKIRKATEIYYRRNKGNKTFNINDNQKLKKTYIGSKIILEILILVLSAVVIFAVKNKEFIFTENFLKTLSVYNVNITEKVRKIFEKENQNQNNFIENEQESITEENSLENNPQEEIVTESEIEVINNQEQQALIKPIEGIISSRFGSRESKYQNVKGNHTGIDIAANSGTVIHAVMAGIVEQVSTEGDYGNHIKVEKDNIETLYAHCDEMYVTEGQEIIQGQEIATVGSTGNSTGPHLHFEIRIDNTPIDPTKMIEF